MILSRREGRSVTVHLVLTTKYRRKALPPHGKNTRAEADLTKEVGTRPTS